MRDANSVFELLKVSYVANEPIMLGPCWQGIPTLASTSGRTLSDLRDRISWRFIPPIGEIKNNLWGIMGFKLLIVVMLAAWLGGCSVVRTYVAELDETSATAYCETKRNNAAVRILAGKLPIVSVDEITPEMLALNAIPSPQEVDAIRILSRDQRDCRDKMDVVAKEHWPTQIALRKNLSLKLDLVTAELLNRRVSYGNANKLYQEAALEAEGLLSVERKEQIEQSRAQEAMAWRTVSEGIRAIAGTQKPEPTADPCTWAGNRVNCNGN